MLMETIIKDINENETSQTQTELTINKADP